MSSLTSSPSGNCVSEDASGKCVVDCDTLKKRGSGFLQCKTPGNKSPWVRPEFPTFEGNPATGIDNYNGLKISERHSAASILGGQQASVRSSQEL